MITSVTTGGTVYRWGYWREAGMLEWTKLEGPPESGRGGIQCVINRIIQVVDQTA